MVTGVSAVPNTNSSISVADVLGRIVRVTLWQEDGIGVLCGAKGPCKQCLRNLLRLLTEPCAQLRRASLSWADLPFHYSAICSPQPSTVLAPMCVVATQS